MRKETKTVVYDEQLHLEAYCFTGLVRPFPNHFHEYYVIGFVEKGQRPLCCGMKEYLLQEGQLLLLNPGDCHACADGEEQPLDYRSLNIPRETMLNLAEEITGKRTLPGFSETVVCDEEISCYFRTLHQMLMERYTEFEKEEYLLLLLSLLIQRYGQPFERHLPECREEIERVCNFIEQHYAEHLCLEQICRCANLSKSALLRAFARSKGVTPYRYLENIRISEAKKLLEKGMAPIEVAMQTGFSDQSHFTNYFTSFIGLSPGAYHEIFSGKNRIEEERDEQTSGPVGRTAF